MKGITNGRRPDWKKCLSVIPEYACIGVLILALLIAGLVSDVFYTTANLQNIMKQGAVLAILATGMGFILISGCLDLTVGINMAICGLIAVIFQDRIGVWGAVLLAITAGIAISCINLFVVYITKGRAMEIMMLTFGLKMAYRGFAQAFTDNMTFRCSTKGVFAVFGKGMVWGWLPVIVIIMLVLAMVLGIVLGKMKFGREVTYIGMNAEASRLAGVSITRIRFFCFVISGVCAAIAGILLTSRTSTIKALSGDNYEMEAVSALVIGGYSIAGGYGSVWRCIVGVYVYTILGNILNLLGAGAYLQTLVEGVVLILAVWLDVYLRMMRAGGKGK